MPNLNYNLDLLNPSSIRNFNYQAQRIGVMYNLSIGEPHYNTPTIIKETCINALNKNNTKYAPGKGINELRNKIVTYEKEHFNHEYLMEEVIITSGSTQGLYLALNTILNKGDEVIVLTPAYPLYKELIKLNGATYIQVDTSSNNFDISKEMLDAKASNKLKAIIINSPNNPTGNIISSKSIKILYNFVKKMNIFLIWDACYDILNYQKKAIDYAYFKKYKDKLIICKSFSKPYAMSGWRIGYVLGDLSIINKMSLVHDFMVVSENTFIQYGAISALDFDISSIVSEYKKNRDYAYKELTKMNLEVNKPSGAFYLYPSIEKFKMSSYDFCLNLVKSKGVAIIPGIFFDDDKHVRISYATSFDELKAALILIKEYVLSLV